MIEQLLVGTILVIVAAFFSVIGWLMVRTLSQIDRNQTELFGRLQRIETDVVRIKAHLELSNDLDL